MYKHRYVLDSTALISCFPAIFDSPSKISDRSASIIHKAIAFDDSAILIIPSVVFVEIYDKWFRGNNSQDDEFREKFKAEIYHPIQTASNIEIRELDIEVLEMFLQLDDPHVNLENHDKIVLATSSVLQAALITSDRKIIRYNNRYQVAPNILE